MTNPTPKTLPDPVTPRWQVGTWTLTAPDGRTWQADSPLKCCAAEQRERIPPEVALQRIFKACDEAPKLPELPPIPVNKQIGYEHIRYVPGYTADFVHEYAIEYAELCLATQPPAVAAIPEGMALVPIEATPEMLERFDNVVTVRGYSIRAGYRAMIKAAPQPPAGQQDRGEADCLAGIYKPAAKAAVDTLIALGYKFGHKPDFDGLAWNAPSPAAPGNGEGGK